MRQLAYVGEDGQIRVRDVNLGSDLLLSQPVGASGPSPGDSFCTWPTWAPDGARIAYFRYQVAGGEVRETGVCIASVDGSATWEVYRTQDGGPIYMCWAPDGESIAVLMQEANQLYLRVIHGRGERPPLTVAQGAPLYFAWQPDSQGLVAHVGVGRSAQPETQLVWIRLDGGRVTQASISHRPATGFRAPSWSARLAGAIVALDAGEGAKLALQAGPDADPETLLSTGFSPAFVLSPRGDTLAYTSRPSPGAALYQGIWLHPLGGQPVRQVSDDPLLALFWCPDGRHLVSTTGDLGNRVIGIRLLDLSTGAQSQLGWVRPARDLWLLLSHFDQYCQSAHLFSPDGEELVLASSRAQERENGSVPTVRQILLRSLFAEGQDRVVAQGRLAFWRPEPTA